MNINEKIPKPYLVFTGNAKDYKQAKTACGLVEWRPEFCSGQLVLDSFEGLRFSELRPFSSFEEAVDEGAKTLLLGFSPFSSDLPKEYYDVVIEAMRNGLHVASGLHNKLEDHPLLEGAALKYGVAIYDFRHREATFQKGSGIPREGKRLLTVGTDCACGKKYTALSISRSLDELRVPNNFRSTGQTGFLISESGINNDTIPADFLTGAAEWLTPPNNPYHWDVIEGQGALSHPSFCAGSMSLIYGTRPDMIVMCHDPVRGTQRGITRPVPPVREEIEYVLAIARRVNPDCKLGAISLFQKDMPSSKARRKLEQELRDEFNVPVFDPKYRHNYKSYSDFIDELKQISDEARNGRQ